MLPLALLAADKVLTEEFKEMESRRNELLKSGQIDKALKLFDEMADLEERNGEIDEASKVRRDKISLLHNAQLDSLLIAEAPIQMAWMEQHDKMAYYYRIWRLMAESYYFDHKPQTALYEAQKMLEHAQQRDDDHGRANAYQQMGFIYLEIDNDEAVKTYLHSITLLKKLKGDVYGDLNRSYGYLCEALENKKDYASELRYCEEWHKVLDEWSKAALSKQMNRVYIELHMQKASALIGLRQLEKAANELAEVERLNQEEQDEYYQYVIDVRRAQLAFLKNDRKEAIALSDRYAPMMESDDWVLPRLVRAEILLSNNRADEAAKIYRQLYVAKDSTFSKEMRMQLDELNTIFKVDELKMQGQLQRSRFIAGIAALAFLVLLLFMYFRHRASKRLKQAHGQLQDAHERLQSAYDQLEETTAAKERIESELRIARDIQMSMVPHVFPEYEGLDLYASMTPAREVGGDLYGYLIDGDKLYFCVGDVSGKGVPASLFMAQAERLFRTLAGQHMMPAQIITRMNTELGADNNQGMFVTMFLGLLDMTTGRLDFCNAGHNPPVIGGDEAQGTLMQLESNAPIGLWPEMEFVGESIDNVKGKPLFIYTDGLTEAENLRQEQFSEERMLSILRQTRFNNSRQVVETLEAEADKFRAGADPNDDLTLMCLRLAE